MPTLENVDDSVDESPAEIRVDFRPRRQRLILAAVEPVEHGAGEDDVDGPAVARQRHHAVLDIEMLFVVDGDDASVPIGRDAAQGDLVEPAEGLAGAAQMRM